MTNNKIILKGLIQIMNKKINIEKYRSNFTYKGPPIDDEDFLKVLPLELNKFLRKFNGFIFEKGLFHLRGVCKYPIWHSLKTALSGFRSIRTFFPILSQKDIPFSQDIYGNQFIIRDDNIFRLDVEKGSLDSLNLSFENFIRKILRKPDDFIDLGIYYEFLKSDETIEPGELINYSPPFSVKQSSGPRSFFAVSAYDQLLYQSQLANSISTSLNHTIPIIERPIASRQQVQKWLSGILNFIPPLEELFKDITNNKITVISGSNNTGKSLILKWLKARFGATSYCIATNRFSYVYHFSTGIRDPLQPYNMNKQFVQTIYQEQQNTENNLLNLEQIIIGLNDSKRSSLFEICGDLLDCSLDLKNVNSDNVLSPKYIEMNGQNVALGSTGTRLLLTLIGICLDERFSTILIDEPELGLSPRIQQRIADLFFIQENCSKYFPHLERIVIATHSHIFLDHTNFSNNYTVSKIGGEIFIEKVKEISDFNRLQFNLLGNTLESLFLPSLIVITEGLTDRDYLERVLNLNFPDLKPIVDETHGEGGIPEKVKIIISIFQDFNKSPYKDRFFTVIDQKHSDTTKDQLIRLGIEETNIIIWEKNGIEYYYPRQSLRGIFHCSDDEIEKMNVENDIIKINGIEKQKKNYQKKSYRR